MDSISLQEKKELTDNVKGDSKPPAESSVKKIDMNLYANKKNAAQSMLDVALLLANVSQLKAVMDQGTSFGSYGLLIGLISISLLLQLAVGVLLMLLVKSDFKNGEPDPKLNKLNNLATGLVLIIVIVNIFITAFGVQKLSSPEQKT